MRYKFAKLDFWEELKATIGDIAVNITDSGDEMLFDFGGVALTPAQEAALIKLMTEKPILRGQLAKLVEKSKQRSWSGWKTGK